MYLNTTRPELKSSLNITTGATVYFVNLTCSNACGGGAVYGYGAMMHIGTKARVIFMNNSANSGGAVYMWYGTTTVGAESSVIFKYNRAAVGGAVHIDSGTLIVDSEAKLTFSHNFADYGGALGLTNSTAHMNSNNIKFYENNAVAGGAMDFLYGTMIINTNTTVEVIMNFSGMRGGAIFIQAGDRPAIIVGNYSKLLFFSNAAFQGGALYSSMPSLLVATVGYKSSIQFINNTAFDVGGAVYSKSLSPCIFMITDYSAKILFIGNRAQHGVGHHMYGASVRDESCTTGSTLTFVNEQGKPHCVFGNNTYHELNISFDPGLNETLSPVSSAPQRVCLCDSNGKPQCANTVENSYN